MAAVNVIRGDNHSSPVDLVRRAQRIFADDGGYDFVYVICDGDVGGLAEANGLAQKSIRNAAKQVTNVKLVANHPCIEYWLLLHFEYSSAPLSAAEALTRLRHHLPDYQKSERKIFEMVAAGLDTACNNASRLKAEHAASGALTPNTEMASLVDTVLTRRGADQRFEVVKGINLLPAGA